MSDASINTIRDMLIGQASALAEEALESLSRAVHADEPEQVALKKLDRRIYPGKAIHRESYRSPRAQRLVTFGDRRHCLVSAEARKRVDPIG